MYKEQIIALLENLRKPYQIKGNEIVTTCLNPEHNDKNPSYSINYIKGSSYCFSCGYSISAPKLLGIKQDDDMLRTSKYLGLSRQWESEEVVQIPEITLPPIDFMITESIRGIPKEILMELGVYYCSHGRYKGRLILPVKDAYGALLGFDARIYAHQDRPNVIPELPQAKYLRPTTMKTSNTLYPLDYLHKHPELGLGSIVLTEGIFDAISYIALGVPALCNFGLGSPSVEKVSHIVGLGCQEITSGFDFDYPGISGWQKIKDDWRVYMKIGKPLELTRKIWDNAKDANSYLEDLKQY